MEGRLWIQCSFFWVVSGSSVIGYCSVSSDLLNIVSDLSVELKICSDYLPTQLLLNLRNAVFNGSKILPLEYQKEANLLIVRK